MRYPTLVDAVERVTDGDNTEPAVLYGVTGVQDNAVQIEASAGATGTVLIGGSLDYAHASAPVFPVVATVTVSANSTHLVWFADMPMHSMKLDLSGLLSGTVTIKTSGTSV